MVQLTFRLSILFLATTIGCGQIQRDSHDTQTVPVAKMQQASSSADLTRQKLQADTSLFRDVMQDGMVERNYPSGNRHCTGQIIDGYRDGEWTYWHENGVVAKRAKYEHGLPVGQWVWFRKDGTRKYSVEYVDGHRHGDSISFHKDGATLAGKSQYKQDVRNGASQRWNTDGTKILEYEFVDGRPNGRLTRWFNNGQKSVEARFFEDRAGGQFTAWDRDGKELRHINWEGNSRLRY